jgi:glycerol-3-phosphate dehydrogenase
VALVEMKDLAYGTSSRSSKLVHGGLRYLEQLEFGLVFESVSERRTLMDIAPHLVQPMGFIFPIYENSRKNLAVISAGMWIYDGLALFRSPRRHKTLKPRDVAEAEPALSRDTLKGAPLYYDCATDDSRLTLESALDAAAEGATVSTWSKVVELVMGEDGRLEGALVENTLSGERKTIRAHAVVNATGPWTDAVLALLGEQSRTMIRPTKGVHIVVNREVLPVNHAVIVPQPNDAQRVVFAVPWGEQTYVGTTDTDYAGDPGRVVADRDDVDYIIEAINQYFPDHQLSDEDVISTWAGLRPLVSPPEPGVSASKVSREHEIMVSPSGLITVAGGKLTTYRKMSGEVVDTVVQLLRISGKLGSITPAQTDAIPLPGAVDWPDDDDTESLLAAIAEAAGGILSERTVALLAKTYGMRGVNVAGLIADDAGLAQPMVEGRPEIMAQVNWAVEYELAATLPDMFIQRTQLFYRDRDQGLGGLEKVAQHMGELLGWNDERRERELARYRQDVALSRAWRSRD